MCRQQVFVSSDMDQCQESHRASSSGFYILKHINMEVEIMLYSRVYARKISNNLNVEKAFTTSKFLSLILYSYFFPGY